MSDGVTDAPGRPAASAARVGLTLGGIVLAAVVVFALGVMEGSRVTGSVPVAPASPSALPTETLKTQPSTPATPVTTIPADKLTFYDRLSGVAPPAPLALPEGQAPAQALTPAPAPAPVPAAAQEVPPHRPAAAPTTATESGPPKKTPAAATVAARTAPPAAAADPAAQIRKLSGKGRYAVQVAAASDPAAAATTAALLKRNGFEPVTVMASVKGKIWYRIRVGIFPNKQAAVRAAGLFKSSFGLNAVAVEN